MAYFLSVKRVRKCSMQTKGSLWECCRFCLGRSHSLVLFHQAQPGCLPTGSHRWLVGLCCAAPGCLPVAPFGHAPLSCIPRVGGVRLALGGVTMQVWGAEVLPSLYPTIPVGPLVTRDVLAGSVAGRVYLGCMCPAGTGGQSRALGEVHGTGPTHQHQL